MGKNVKSSNAYTLIRSMEMSEKRHFRIFSKRHIIGDQNKYVQLFALLEESAEYDEQKLRDTATALGYHSQYIKADQNYLYRLLLRSLVDYHESKTLSSQVRQLLSEIELLFAKGLFLQCQKQIIRTKELCRRCEKWDGLQSALYWERKLGLLNLAFVSRTKEVVKEMKEVIGIHENLILYTELYEQAVELRNGIVVSRNAQAMGRFKKFMQQKALQTNQQVRSVQARIRYKQIHAMWCNVIGERKQELKWNREIIDLMEGDVSVKTEAPLDYINVYSRILSIVKEVEPRNFRKEMDIFRKFTLPPGTAGATRVMAQVFNFSYMMELSDYLGRLDFAGASAIAKDVEEGYRIHQRFIPGTSRITLQYMLAYVYFGVGDLRAARKKINTILTDFDPDLRPEIYQFARLLNVLVHYELGNYSLVRSEANSAIYYYRKKKQEHKTEQVVLHFFRSPDRYRNAGKDAFAELKSKLESLQHDRLESLASRYFDFVLWAEAKSVRKTMTKVSAGRTG